MSHVGKRPRENRERRAEGVEKEEGLSASCCGLSEPAGPGKKKRACSMCVQCVQCVGAVCACVCSMCMQHVCGV